MTKMHNLMDTLCQVYEISTDWTASLYCGVTLEWDYTTNMCDLSIPGYVEEALKASFTRYQHDHSIHHTHGQSQAMGLKYNM